MASRKWGKVPLAVISDWRLTQRELRVYIALATFADPQGRCYPKRERIAEITGIRLSHISDATTRLGKLGYLAKVGNGGRNRPAQYLLCAGQKGPDTGTVSGQERVPDGRTVYEGQKGPATGTRSEQVGFKGTPSAKDSPPVGESHGVSIRRVMDHYNEILPELPNAKAAAAMMVSDFSELKRRWSKAESEDWWRKYFESVRRSSFLMDTTGEKKRKPTTLAWLLKYDNAVKVLNGEYLDNQPSKASPYGRTLGDGQPDWMKGAI